MTNVKAKRKNNDVLTVGQNRLQKESLKQLLGNGLTASRSVRTQREEKASFLKGAINSKILNS